MEEQRNIESLIDAKRSRPGLGTLRLALTDFHQKRLLASGRREQPVTLSPFPIGARSRAARDRLTQTRLDPAWARAISARAAEAKEERERLERERRWERISRKEAGPLVLLAWRRYKTRILDLEVQAREVRQKEFVLMEEQEILHTESRTHSTFSSHVLVQLLIPPCGMCFVPSWQKATEPPVFEARCARCRQDTLDALEPWMALARSASTTNL